MSPFHVAILEVIEANHGSFSWYQLDRALSNRAEASDPALVSTGLMPAPHQLEAAGFITTSGGPAPGQPLYSLTPAGREQLERTTTGTSIVR
jgi:DNA-binding PadR family transcriptional regulator